MPILHILNQVDKNVPNMNTGPMSGWERVISCGLLASKEVRTGRAPRLPVPTVSCCVFWQVISSPKGLSPSPQPWRRGLHDGLQGCESWEQPTTFLSWSQTLRVTPVLPRGGLVHSGHSEENHRMAWSCQMEQAVC